MDDQHREDERLELLQRLNNTELVVLNERWAGRTSSEIAGVLGIEQAVARFHLGNVYDKLEVTYPEEGTSLSRIMAFYAVLDDPNAPAIPAPESLLAEELTSPPRSSEQALELVQDDDEALLAQRPVRPVDEAEPPLWGRRWFWPTVAIIIAGVVIVALLVILLRDDDEGDDDEAARAETATAFTQRLDSTATALAGLATLDRQDLDATATALSAIATQEREAADMTATEAANATASAQPTPTEEPTATPEPTDTPEPTETPASTPTLAPEVTPTPSEGEMVYEADWEENPDEWELDDNWTIEDGMLASTNSGLRILLAPTEVVDLQTPDYAIEAVITITELNDCDGVAGLMSRAMVQPQSQDQEEFVSGYIGTVCRDSWTILTIPEDDPEAEELASGDFGENVELDDQEHTYRLEIVGDTLRYFLDDEFLGEAIDDKHQDVGDLGFYLDEEVNIEVSAFRIFAIESQ